MHVALLFCEDATVRRDGRLDIRGVTSELHATGFPAKQDRIVVAGHIEWGADVRGRQPFQINLVDENGKSLLTVQGHSDVAAHPSPHGRPRTPLVLPLESVVFPEAGRYLVVADAGNQRFEGASLTVLQPHNTP